MRCFAAWLPRSLLLPNWSRPLPQPLVIPDVMKLITLADVRALIERHLPAHCRVARRGKGSQGGGTRRRHR
jgi:hypothetical protein